MNSEMAVGLILQKNEVGLTYLYDNYAAALKGVVHRIVNSEELSEEIIQETFMKIWSKMDSYDASKSQLFTWMMRIARNTAIDQKRLKKHKNDQKTDSFDVKFHNLGSVEDHSEMDIIKITKGLPAKYKSVLDCVYLQGYTHQEASEKLDIPMGTLKTRLRKSIDILRESIKDETLLFTSWVFILFIIFKYLWS